MAASELPAEAKRAVGGAGVGQRQVGPQGRGGASLADTDFRLRFAGRIIDRELHELGRRVVRITPGDRG